MNSEKLRPALERTEPSMPYSSIQHEDAALKTAFRYFSDELLPYFGIQKKVVEIAPTELVHLDVKIFHEDFNFIMDDGSWAHFEFQSKNEGLDGLKRFRAYEALASYQYKVPVTTYVLFSGRVRKPMAEFTEGVNTFRIVPIVMQEHNADELITGLQGKQQSGQKFVKEDLVLLPLCLLMGGEMSLKDRARAAYQITREAASVEPEERDNIETVLYVMADKFLDAAEMDELMEVIGMTQLGQKLLKKGIEQGIEQEKLEIAENLIGLLDEQMIAERTGLPLKTVLELKEKRVAISVQ